MMTTIQVRRLASGDKVRMVVGGGWRGETVFTVGRVFAEVADNGRIRRVNAIEVIHPNGEQYRIRPESCYFPLVRA